MQDTMESHAWKARKEKKKERKKESTESLEQEMQAGRRRTLYAMERYSMQNDSLEK